MINAFIFDMDGLLVETESIQIRAFEEFMAAKGLDSAPGYADSFVGFSIRNNIQRLQSELGLSGRTDDLVAERNALYLEMLAASAVEPLPGVAALFGFAEENALKTAVCSSSDRAQLDIVLPRLLAALGRNPRPNACFDAIVCGNDVQHLKPAPDLYLECARRLALPPERCLAFEDSRAGALSAHAAGMPLVVVPNHFSRAVADWPTPSVFPSLADSLASGLITAAGGVVSLSRPSR